MVALLAHTAVLSIYVVLKKTPSVEQLVVGDALCIITIITIIITAEDPPRLCRLLVIGAVALRIHSATSAVSAADLPLVTLSRVANRNGGPLRFPHLGLSRPSPTATARLLQGVRCHLTGVL